MLNVYPMVLQGRLLFEVFPLHQMSSKEGENGREKGRETKGETKRESERDVICLQSIGCTSDHSWDPTIISFHLSASFNFLSLFLIPFLLIFLF